MQDLIQDIATRQCPSCGARGTIGLVIQQYRFLCAHCRATVDPFEVGPWDSKHRIFDTLDGEQVSFYVAEVATTEPVEPNKNWLDFYRQRFAGSNKRVIKQGG